MGQDAGIRHKSSRSSLSSNIFDNKLHDMSDIDNKNGDEDLDPDQLVDDLGLEGEGDEVDKNVDANDIDDKNAAEDLEPEKLVDDLDLEGEDDEVDKNVDANDALDDTLETVDT